MHNLEIHPGGKLFWYPIGKPKREVSEISYSFLFEKCIIADGVTLRDIFLLLKQNEDIYDKILGNWLRDFLKEAFTLSEEKTDLDYLALEWQTVIESTYSESNPGETGIYGNCFPELNGYGPGPDSNVEVIRWAISMTPVSKMIDLPLRFLKRYQIVNQVTHHEAWKNGGDTLVDSHTQEFDDSEVLFGQILHGIMYEISFYGPPKDRDGTRESMEELSQQSC